MAHLTNDLAAPRALWESPARDVPMSDRARAIAWATEVINDPSSVFFDSETTGLGPDAELCEIGIVDGTGTVLLDTLVWPLRSIPREATRVHGISDRDVMGAPVWPFVANDLRRLLSGRRVVVYNAAFDAGMVNQCCDALGLRPFAHDWECAMKAYAEFDGTRTRAGRVKWHTLDAAARAFGMEPGGHRARADAESCRWVVAAMASAG